MTSKATGWVIIRTSTIASACRAPLYAKSQSLDRTPTM